MSLARDALVRDLKAAADAFVTDLTVKLVQGRKPVRLEPAQIEWLRGRLAILTTTTSRAGTQYARDSRRPPPLPAKAEKDGGPWPSDEDTTTPQRVSNRG